MYTAPTAARGRRSLRTSASSSSTSTSHRLLQRPTNASTNVNIVELTVPPGPLGILLGNASHGPSVLEGYAPVAASGERGAVERSGRVPVGSALIGVNQYDLEAAALSFQDIGRVLRETSHMERRMRFRLPADKAVEATPQPGAYRAEAPRMPAMQEVPMPNQSTNQRSNPPPYPTSMQTTPHQYQNQSRGSREEVETQQRNPMQGSSARRRLQASNAAPQVTARVEEPKTTTAEKEKEVVTRGVTGRHQLRTSNTPLMQGSAHMQEVSLHEEPKEQARAIAQPQPQSHSARAVEPAEAVVQTTKTTRRQLRTSNKEQGSVHVQEITTKEEKKGGATQGTTSYSVKTTRYVAEETKEAPPVVPTPAPIPAPAPAPIPAPAPAPVQAPAAQAVVTSTVIASSASVQGVTTTTTSASTSVPSQGFTTTTSSAPAQVSIPAPAPVTATAPSVPAAPVATQPSLSSQASDAAAPERIVTVTVQAPPGPLGLNLDGAVTDKVIVRGYSPLPDGSVGELEKDGRILSGSVLVQVNDYDVSTWSFNEVVAKLGELGSESRALTFMLPDPSTTAANEFVSISIAMPSDRDNRPTIVEDLEKRRALELALVMKYDTDQISRYECWFMIHTEWMESWIRFVAQNGPLPGHISNDKLLIFDWETRLRDSMPGRPDEPRPDLKLMTDYRAVPPMVWCLYVELYGTAGTPPLARYLLDIYSEPLRETALESILQELRLKATSLVHQLREQCQVQQQQ